MAYDVILLCGQSNAEGNGLGETDFPYVPDEKIIMMRDNGWYGYKKQPDGTDKRFLTEPYDFVTETASERFDGEKHLGMFVLSFCKKYVESGLLENGRKLLIINASIGGTGFARKEWGVGNLLHNRLFTMLDEALRYSFSGAFDDVPVTLSFLQAENSTVTINIKATTSVKDFLIPSL